MGNCHDQKASWSIVGALLVLGQTMGNSDSQNSPRPGLGGSHHLPPYSILCECPQGPHLNSFLFRDSQVGVLKLPKLGLLQLWGSIVLHVDLRLNWGLSKVIALGEIFSTMCCTSPACRKLGRFFTFSG
jgi:hypothetical protein